MPTTGDAGPDQPVLCDGSGLPAETESGAAGGGPERDSPEAGGGGPVLANDCVDVVLPGRTQSLAEDVQPDRTLP